MTVFRSVALDGRLADVLGLVAGDPVVVLWAVIPKRGP